MSQKIEFKSNKGWMAGGALALLLSSTPAFGYALNENERHVVLEYDRKQDVSRNLSSILDMDGFKATLIGGLYDLKPVKMSRAVAGLMNLRYSTEKPLEPMMLIHEPANASGCTMAAMVSDFAKATLNFTGNRASGRSTDVSLRLHLSALDKATGPCTKLAQAVQKRQKLSLSFSNVPYQFVTEEGKQESGDLDLILVTIK